MKEFDAEALDVKIGISVHRLLLFKQRLAEILNRYETKEPDEIKRKIERREIPSHPCYEDYLDALACKLELKSLWTKLETDINNLKAIAI